MAVKRLILEMGQGVDLHGRDYTKAAERAVDDALRHASLTIFRSLTLDPAGMQVDVRIGVQAPEAVDAARVAAKLPYGEARVACELGGLDVGGPDDPTVIASAALVVSYDMP